jgi:hypothetical protein
MDVVKNWYADRENKIEEEETLEMNVFIDV